MFVDSFLICWFSWLLVQYSVLCFGNSFVEKVYWGTFPRLNFELLEGSVLVRVPQRNRTNRMPACLPACLETERHPGRCLTGDWLLHFGGWQVPKLQVAVEPGTANVPLQTLPGRKNRCSSRKAIRQENSRLLRGGSGFILFLPSTAWTRPTTRLYSRHLFRC